MLVAATPGRMMAVRAFLLLSLGLGSAALMLPCSPAGSSRMASSRVATVSMCDAAEPAPVAEEPAAAPVEAAAEGTADAGERRPPRKGPPRTAKKPLAELEVGSTVEGTIRSVQSYGAFVDLGARRPSKTIISLIAF